MTTHEQPGKGDWISKDLGSELASRRTGMAFERTRIAGDRTLMSIMRTSLSLISFGFTIFQFFRYLSQNVAPDAPLMVGADSARNFGMALVFLGELLLFLGIIGHVRFLKRLGAEHREMTRQGLLHGPKDFPYSTTLLVSFLLLVLGIGSLFGMVLRAGPFD